LRAGYDLHSLLRLPHSDYHVLVVVVVVVVGAAVVVVVDDDDVAVLVVAAAENVAFVAVVEAKIVRWLDLKSEYAHDVAAVRDADVVETVVVAAAAAAAEDVAVVAVAGKTFVDTS